MGRQLLVMICSLSVLIVGLANDGGTQEQAMKTASSSRPTKGQVTQLFRDHFSRLLKERADDPGFTSMKPRWNKLMRAEVLAFSADTAFE